MPIVYRKSAKGLHELETRANRLMPRLRTALIVVDGRRSDVELRALIQAEPDATLLALLEGGYIEVSVTLAAAEPPAVTSARAAPAAPVTQAAQAARQMADVRRLAVRSLTDRLGPGAETAALRIEKAQSWSELRAALEYGQRVLQLSLGASAATEFRTRFIDKLAG